MGQNPAESNTCKVCNFYKIMILFFFHNLAVHWIENFCLRWPGAGTATAASGSRCGACPVTLLQQNEYIAFLAVYCHILTMQDPTGGHVHTADTDLPRGSQRSEQELPSQQELGLAPGAGDSVAGAHHIQPPRCSATEDLAQFQYFLL